MNVHARLVVAALIAGSAGCVPLSDYKAMEKRFQEQETYVVKHKDDVRGLEKREQVLTLRAREQQRQIELLRTRLEKSETMRERLAAQMASKPEPAAVPASTPKVEQPTQAEFLGLEVNPATRGLVLENGVFFEPGKAVLKPQGEKILRDLLTELNKPAMQGRIVRVEGHTDDMPITRSGHSSNWELSAKRALAVLHFFEKSGIAPDRLCFAGYGPHRPLAPGKDDSARQKNRRVEIVLLER